MSSVEKKKKLKKTKKVASDNDSDKFLQQVDENLLKHANKKLAKRIKEAVKDLEPDSEVSFEVDFKNKIKKEEVKEKKLKKKKATGDTVYTNKELEKFIKPLIKVLKDEKKMICRRHLFQLLRDMFSSDTTYNYEVGCCDFLSKKK